jgi:hypothetical protein
MLEEGVGEAIPKMRPMKEDLPQGRRGAEGLWCGIGGGLALKLRTSNFPPGEDRSWRG